MRIFLLVLALAFPSFAQTVSAPTSVPTSASVSVAPTLSALGDKATAFTLPSAQPSGVPVNDLIPVAFYPAQTVRGPVPAVLLLHYLGAGSNSESHDFARYLQTKGIASAVVRLPWHGRRSPPGSVPYRRYLGAKADIVVQAWSQATSDVLTVVDWLAQQPNVDTSRLGAVGVSMGAILTHRAMGLDARVKAGVAFLGGGDFLDIYKTSLAGRIILRDRPQTITPEDVAALRSVDPLREASRNRPRRVLMVAGARDLVIPPADAEKLWNALGRPPIRWIDTNHTALRLAQNSAQRAAHEFLLQAWSDVPADQLRAPDLNVPTLKAGFLAGADSGFTPALTLQVLGVGTRRHMTLLHADIGIGLRGPFVGAALTVNQFVDVGVGRRVFGKSNVRPYASFHVAF